ncbi:hypothetical protein [Costertonia aggregata]|uniref:PepSY domain-containing protein n=1 Tax=Costertonia aggregata TaxID=343403 RepID=A0A7H9AQE9_9FLAO|nr:hypothetical protein [Costertonia aggregata]QLG45653.1 hypothetical protein HYG79_09945 [Costertonia aggregata]
MRIKLYVLLLVLFNGVCIANAQNKYEREYRIKKSQFPKKALGYIQEKLEGAKRIKFYKETDSSKVSYEAKFKKDRLWYSIEFDDSGAMEDIEILIKPVDIPEDTFKKIEQYLTQKFTKYKIQRLQQQYPVMAIEATEKTVKNAFQNLMIPTINYELVISGREKETYEQFEILFDAEGNFVNIRKSLPPNYDHVLY